MQIEMYFKRKSECQQRHCTITSPYLVGAYTTIYCNGVKLIVITCVLLSIGGDKFFVTLQPPYHVNSLVNKGCNGDELFITTLCKNRFLFK